MGYIVENDVIVAALHRQMKTLTNVEVLEGLQVVDIDKNDKASLLTCHLNDKSPLVTKLLVGADGAMSTVRKAANMKQFSYSYNQVAVVATLQLSEPTNNITAWQRFLPSGPIALLPLSDETSSLVWSTSPHQANSLVTMPDDNFVDAVNSAFVRNCLPACLPAYLLTLQVCMACV
jgi:ubiquinone biosynthesis monooxygenase Coq6